MNSGKSPLSSKTLVFNGIALVIGIAMAYGYKEFKPDASIEPLVGGIVALLQLVVPIISPVINMGLRLVTKERIRL